MTKVYSYRQYAKAEAEAFAILYKMYIARLYSNASLRGLEVGEERYWEIVITHDSLYNQLRARTLEILGREEVDPAN